MGPERDDEPSLPHEPIDRLVEPVERFLHVEAAGGIVLLACTMIALVLANSPFADAVDHFWHAQIGVVIGRHQAIHSLAHWVNDGLMVLFFFVVGLEVKRELVLGELRDPRRAALPVAAAFGGMVAPAAVYLALRAGTPEARGWGIAMATDIAFVVGCMALLGSRIAPGLRVMLLSLAIVDDIGAILVIALGYATHLDLAALGLGLAGIAGVSGLRRLGVRSLGVYTLVGLAVWVAFLRSGVHATIAGVLLGLATPAHPYLETPRFAPFVERAFALVRRGQWPQGGVSSVRRLRAAARETVSPLEYLEQLLHPWVAFVVMPVFALANAGVPIEMRSFGDPVAIAVAAGLVIGKPLGVVLASWLAVRIGMARLPDGVGWRAIVGAGALAGIGFTMALFVAELALTDAPLQTAKVGILVGSAVAAVIGTALLVSGGRGEPGRSAS
jgi:NhaA family Na+:H+ antiporter